MAPRDHRHRIAHAAILAVLAHLLSACAPVGENSQPPAAAQLPAQDPAVSAAPLGALLLIEGDTVSGFTRVDARLVAVQFESVDGTRTPNLLREETILTLADASGSSHGLPLREIPAGHYQALILGVDPASVAATRLDGGREPVGFDPVHGRVGFAPIEIADPRGSWVIVRSRVPSPSAVAPTDGEDRSRFEPAFEARVSSLHTVHGLECRWLAFEEFVAYAVMPDWGDLVVELAIESVRRNTPSELFEVGGSVRIDAMLVGWRALEVLSVAR